MDKENHFLEATPKILRHRAAWHLRGEERPPFAIDPAEGDESVWDYPRPPRIESDPRRIEVMHGDVLLASTQASIRVLETASPPTFYISPDDVQTGLLEPSGAKSLCEWKGIALDISLRSTHQSIGWHYPEVYPEFAAIKGWFSFYPARVACYVNQERVLPQPGGYYGGWITKEVTGPFKGEPGYDGM